MKVYVQTYGCSFNQSDSEVMSGVLKEAGHELVQDADQAEVVVVNSCVVKNQTQKELFRFIEDTKAKGKQLVIAGCAPSSIPEKLEGLSKVGVTQVHQIASAVDETTKGNTVDYTKQDEGERLALPKMRKNPVVEIIPISKGCLGSCTYCLTVEARGKLDSYQGRDIKHAAEQAIKEGVTELWLTSQDTACWGMDIKQRLPELVESLTHIEGNFFIRIGMGNPNWFKVILPELIEVLKHPKVFKFIHIPLQAGNDEVLTNMKRGYKAQAYIDCVNKLKQEIPNITIATDIICGFPGETNEQFEDTLKAIQETKPQVINISRFAARPKTPAATMDNQVDGAEMKRRSQATDKLHLEIRKEWLEQMIGKEFEVIIEDVKEGKCMGRTKNYTPVVISQELKLGSSHKVKIKEVTTYHVRGELIPQL